MPRAMKRASAVVLAALSFAASPASAHAVLIASTPPIGGTIPAGHAELTFRYNSRIDRARSVLRITGPDKVQTPLPIAPDNSVDRLHAEADLAPGAYVVRWQVLAIDGHITRGDVPFTVTPKP